MDFSKINPIKEAEKSATYHVEYDGELLFEGDKPIEMDFLGTESAVGRRAAARMAKRADRRQSKKGRQRQLKDMSEEDILAMAREGDTNRASFYADLCTGWRNVTYIPDDKLDDPKAKAEPLEFSRDNAEMLFRTRPWIMEGIDDFLLDKANWRREQIAG